MSKNKAKDFIEVTVANEALRKLLGVQEDEVVKVKVKNGIPLDRDWRNRFRDAAIDKCISLCNNAAKKSSTVADK